PTPTAGPASGGIKPEPAPAGPTTAPDGSPSDPYPFRTGNSPPSPASHDRAGGEGGGANDGGVRRSTGRPESGDGRGLQEGRGQVRCRRRADQRSSADHGRRDHRSLHDDVRGLRSADHAVRDALLTGPQRPHSTRVRSVRATGTVAGVVLIAKKRRSHAQQRRPARIAPRIWMSRSRARRAPRTLAMKMSPKPISAEPQLTSWSFGRSAAGAAALRTELGSWSSSVKTR